MSGKAWWEVILKQGGLIYCASGGGGSVERERDAWKMSEAWEERGEKKRGG